MLRIGILSDLHFGYDSNSPKRIARALAKLAEQGISVLIISGDLIASKQNQLSSLFKLVRKYFPAPFPVLIVRGNHDFWDDDCWNNKYSPRYKKYSWPVLMKEQDSRFEAFGIHHLEKKPFVLDNVVILGFDGWYGNTRPPTKDLDYMPQFIEGVPTHVYLSSKAGKDLNWVLNQDTSQYRAAICVTHFPTFIKRQTRFSRMVDSAKRVLSKVGFSFYDQESELSEKMSANLRYHEFLTEQFDVLIAGHSHKRSDWIERGCRIINSGGYYTLKKSKRGLDFVSTDEPEFSIIEI